MKTFSRILTIILTLISLSQPACQMYKEQPHEESHRKIVVTSPKAKDVILTQPYVCQIHSQVHIEVRALQSGYLNKIAVQEGQKVKKGDLMFMIFPVLYETRLKAEQAEAKVARLEYEYAKQLLAKTVISENEVLLLQAKMEKAQAKADQAQAELKFCSVEAPFDGIVDVLHKQLGSLIKENDILTTLSDNSVMWVYFNVPEKQYLEYMAGPGEEKYMEGIGQVKDDRRIELVLASGSKFPQPAKAVRIEAKFNNETGNIKFRADFENVYVGDSENRKGLLRQGQTGTVLIHRTLKNAMVIPQRATFELLDKRYVYVVGEDQVVHQRLITIQHELEDIFVIKSGLDVKDKIVLEGGWQLHEGDKVEYEFCTPEEALSHQKNPAE